MTSNLPQADAPLKPAFWIAVRPAGRYFPTMPLLSFYVFEQKILTYTFKLGFSLNWDCKFI
jgi:hypothetical protein